MVGMKLVKLTSVSILYEANEVCNEGRGEVAPQGVEVSILYEANEVCNMALGRAS